MANLIGGIPPYRGINNHIIGTVDADVIFGDPYTTTIFWRFPKSAGQDWPPAAAATTGSRARRR